MVIWLFAAMLYCITIASIGLQLDDLWHPLVIVPVVAVVSALHLTLMFILPAARLSVSPDGWSLWEARRCVGIRYSVTRAAGHLDALFGCQVRILPLCESHRRLA
jgi:hypothetical protein